MYKSFQEKKNCQIIAKTYCSITGIGFCCLINCRLHYPAGKATAELPTLQFSSLSSGKCQSLGLKSKLFSTICTAQKNNASFLPIWGLVSLTEVRLRKLFLFVCFTANRGTPLHSTVQRSLTIADVTSPAFGEAAKPDFCKTYLPCLPILSSFQGVQSSS